MIACLTALALAPYCCSSTTSPPRASLTSCRVLPVALRRAWLVVLCCSRLLASAGAVSAAQRGGGAAERGWRRRRRLVRGLIRRPASSFATATRRHCAEMPRADSAGYMQRISYERKTPEGWEMSVRRMVGAQRREARPGRRRARSSAISAINQGLAPAEMRPGRFETERRMIEYRYTADPKTETTCRACHSMGRVITQRRTRGEWELLLRDASRAVSRRRLPGVPSRRSGDERQRRPQSRIRWTSRIAHLARVFPLRTPEWTAWSATMRPPHLEGRGCSRDTSPGAARSMAS